MTIRLLTCTRIRIEKPRVAPIESLSRTALVAVGEGVFACKCEQLPPRWFFDCSGYAADRHATGIDAETTPFIDDEGRCPALIFGPIFVAMRTDITNDLLWYLREYVGSAFGQDGISAVSKDLAARV